MIWWTDASSQNGARIAIDPRRSLRNDVPISGSWRGSRGNDALDASVAMRPEPLSLAWSYGSRWGRRFGRGAHVGPVPVPRRRFVLGPAVAVGPRAQAVQVGVAQAVGELVGCFLSLGLFDKVRYRPTAIPSVLLQRN